MKCERCNCDVHEVNERLCGWCECDIRNGLKPPLEFRLVIPTPRTESARVSIAQRIDVNYYPEMVLASFARELERENNRLKVEIAGLTGGYVQNGIALRHLGGDRFEKI